MYRGFIQKVMKKTSEFLIRTLYIYRLVWEAKPVATVVLLFLTVIKGLYPIVLAWIAKSVIDLIVTATINGNFSLYQNQLMYLCILYTFLFFFVQIVYSVEFILNQLLGNCVSNHIKIKIMNKVNHITIGSFDSPEFYNKYENASREASDKPVGILITSFSVVSSIISVIGFIAIIGKLSYLSVAIILISALPGAIINYKCREKTFTLLFKQSKDRREMTYYSGLFLNKDLIKEVKLYGMANFIINKYNKIFKKYYYELKQLFLAQAKLSVFGTLLSIIGVGGMYMWLAQLAISGRVTIGEFTLYSGALISFGEYISNIIERTSKLYEGTLFVDNLIHFLSEVNVMESTSTYTILPSKYRKHCIELRNVSFKYPHSDHYILKNVNLIIDGGESIAIVGLNGAGKSTLLKIIMRLYDPTEGEVLLDGRNIKDYDTKELFTLFGTVFQDFGKYAFTIRENIALGEIDKINDKVKIKEAAGKSEIDTFIEKLCLQYDTPLTRQFENEGVELSIGQWQKIALARAFFRDAKIIILDEPTASLDPLSEHEIFDQFNKLREEKTTIYVSHRLSNVTAASRIIVLDNGEIIEAGTHKELIEINGYYCRLFKIQAEKYSSLV